MSKEMKNIKVPSYMKEMGEGMFAGMGMPVHRYQCSMCKGPIKRSAFGAPKCSKCGFPMQRID